MDRPLGSPPCASPIPSNSPLQGSNPADHGERNPVLQVLTRLPELPEPRGTPLLARRLRAPGIRPLSTKIDVGNSAFSALDGSETGGRHCQADESDVMDGEGGRGYGR